MRRSWRLRMTRALGGAHLPEGFQGPLGAGLLGEGDAGVDQDDDQDDDRVQPVPRLGWR